MNACLERMRQDFEGQGARIEVIEHRPAYTAQETAAVGHVSGHDFVKAVVAMVDGAPVVLGLPASREVDFAALRAQLGARDVRLAREDEFEALFPDCEVGAMPPLRGPAGVPLYLDEDVLQRSEIVFDGGSHETAVRVSLDDYLRVATPQVLRFGHARAGEQTRQARRPRRRWQRRLAILAASAAGIAALRGLITAARRQPLAATLLGGAAIGSTVTALLDPHGGRRRRALVRDKGRRYARMLGRGARGEAHRAYDRARGIAAEQRRRGAG